MTTVASSVAIAPAAVNQLLLTQRFTLALLEELPLNCSSSTECPRGCTVSLTLHLNRESIAEPLLMDSLGTSLGTRGRVLIYTSATIFMSVWDSY